MVIDGNDNIQIKQILMSGDRVSFVEFYSYSDSRNHIINAERFMESFGYSIEDLKQLQQKEK